MVVIALFIRRGFGNVVTFLWFDETSLLELVSDENRLAVEFQMLVQTRLSERARGKTEESRRRTGCRVGVESGGRFHSTPLRCCKLASASEPPPVMNSRRARLKIPVPGDSDFAFSRDAG